MPAKQPKRSRRFPYRATKDQNLTLVKMREIAHGERFEFKEVSDRVFLRGLEATVYLEFVNEGIAVDARAMSPSYCDNAKRGTLQPKVADG